MYYVGYTKSRIHMGYSKFANVLDKTPGVPSRVGMFILYFPVIHTHATHKRWG
jgi:hypothetical protein